MAISAKKNLSYRLLPRKGASSHFYQHLRPVPFARAKYNRARVLRGGLRHGSTATVRIPLETEFRTSQPASKQEHARGGNDHQRNQLLPIHHRKDNLKISPCNS